MTREEAISKYGRTPCFFYSYYKYAFTFRGVADDGKVIFIKIGGYNADDIYRFSCSANEPETIDMNICGANDDPLRFSVEEMNGEVIIPMS